MVLICGVNGAAAYADDRGGRLLIIRPASRAR